MLQSIRKVSDKPVIKLLITGVLVFAFGLWGVGDVVTNVGSSPVAYFRG